MKVIFFGTSDYCLPVLEALHSNFDLKLVITRPDKPIGRKKVLTPSATKTWASEHKIPTSTPETLKKDTQDRISLIRQISHIRPMLAVVSDYGLIIPKEIFDKPRLGTLNIHFSKLPGLRGPSPVQYTLLRGDTEAWITIFKLENPPELVIKMDSGPILWQNSYPIDPDDTTQTLYTRLFQEAAKELPKTIRDYSLQSTAYVLKPQDHSKATYCRFIKKEDGFVKYEDLQNPKTYNTFRAMTPWPTLWTIHPNGKRMIVRKCHLKNDMLTLDEVQFEGKEAMLVSDLGKLKWPQESPPKVKLSQTR